MSMSNNDLLSKTKIETGHCQRLRTVLAETVTKHLLRRIENGPR